MTRPNGQSSLSDEQAAQEVRACVKASRTSFGAGMAILPAKRREGMYALYAFCRIVDDIADDGATEKERREGLQAWREKISALFQKGLATEATTLALRPAIAAFGLVEKDFQDIIDGMEMDAGAPIMAPDAATLDLYCDRVASAVGRASVRIFGDASPKAMEVAYHLGRAFQLTNILRDLAEDAARGRLYLPQELLTEHGVSTSDLTQLLSAPALPAVCRDLAREAGDHFAKADAAMALCLRAAMRPARLMRAYYGRIFQELLKADWKAPSQRVSLSTPCKIWVLFHALLRSYVTDKV